MEFILEKVTYNELDSIFIYCQDSNKVWAVGLLS